MFGYNKTYFQWGLERLWAWVGTMDKAVSSHVGAGRAKRSLNAQQGWIFNNHPCYSKCQHCPILIPAWSFMWFSLLQICSIDHGKSLWLWNESQNVKPCFSFIGLVAQNKYTITTHSMVLHPSLMCFNWWLKDRARYLFHIVSLWGGAQCTNSKITFRIFLSK